MDTTSLFSHERALLTDEDEKTARAQLSSWITDFFGDVGIKQLLGEADRSVAENVVFEVALNAHRHEGTRAFRIFSQSNNIALHYESNTYYGLEELMAEARGRGGFDSLEMLETETQGRVNLNYRASSGHSQWICSVARLGYADDPCAINLHDMTDVELEIFKSDCVGCTQVHVHGHLHDHSSDNWVTARYVKQLVDEGYQVVVHSKPGPMAKHLRKTITDMLDGRENFELSVHA
ncbi:hypothetical protein ARTSIC4J27_3169 [Pseudarthrobacter siccitolerans]|uniref:Uncharacterized protein n=2 Tax=Pseudarthrobacter siccitolerans TaxID=861266 RepID=A0A024H5Z1_9MICC|nr:hypothetical protein ARTSIC4J27_3169 [Pseudarthrobacter siccitolerans]